MIKKSRDLFTALQNNVMLSLNILILHVGVGFFKLLFVFASLVQSNFCPQEFKAIFIHYFKGSFI
jgi:hypothetical protein